MIIKINGKQCRGDLIKSAVLRSDLSPIPVTLEAVIRVDDDLVRSLAEGQTIEVGGDKMYIVKSHLANNHNSQGEHEYKAVQITAYLDNVHQTSFVLRNAILKENSTLQQIYKATGATLQAIDNDIQVKKFYCYAGNYPTLDIAMTLQCEGGVVRWKKGKMEFKRVQDLFKQKGSITLADNSMTDLDSGFLERHTIPSYYSIAPDGSFVYGNKNKTRSAVFVPDKDERQLQNMSRVLINRKTAKIGFDTRLCAGDLIDVQGGKPLVIITAAHVFQTGTDDGSSGSQFTKLWLGDINE